MSSSKLKGALALAGVSLTDEELSTLENGFESDHSDNMVPADRGGRREGREGKGRGGDDHAVHTCRIRLVWMYVFDRLLSVSFFFIFRAFALTTDYCWMFSKGEGGGGTDNI